MQDNSKLHTHNLQRVEKMVCINCGDILHDRSCKVRCLRCGYFEDCSDGGNDTPNRIFIKIKE